MHPKRKRHKITSFKKKENTGKKVKTQKQTNKKN